MPHVLSRTLWFVGLSPWNISGTFSPIGFLYELGKDPTVGRQGKVNALIECHPFLHPDPCLHALERKTFYVRILLPSSPKESHFHLNLHGYSTVYVLFWL
ncbi:hypothetical protein B0J14DRAFT_267985 [Halenospora varia]|nr:hypothetical protein B0J14DRAFT_267985 [Halenospora varia]